MSDGVDINQINLPQLTIEAVVDYGKALLSLSSDSAKLDTQLLLCFVLNKSRSYLLTWPEKTLEQQYFDDFLLLLKRRAVGEPIAYILGVKEFWSLPFNVSPATLIPRPDTEVMIELILELFGDKCNYNCLDLGTGTGAIAISLASELPTWKIEALDYSEEAVALAKVNAKQLNQAHVKIYQSDWFSEVASDKKFNIIVSNPPYIDAQDQNLKQGDVRFEPSTALIADEQGLADIKHIAEIAISYLANDGVVFFEHGFEQGGAVRQLLTVLGYQHPKTVKDLNAHDRVTWATVGKIK